MPVYYDGRGMRQDEAESCYSRASSSRTGPCPPARETAGVGAKMEGAMSEPEHIDELVRLTKAGALTWRQTWGVTRRPRTAYAGGRS